jgi:acyl phosphate:glycerol-3-phosphate acyltransferase
MEISILTIALFSVAYLLGSIPSAVWIGKMLYGIDVREHGSKNAGATNTVRVLGWKAGLPVLSMDILKGFLAVKLVYIYGLYVPGTKDFVNLQLALGGFAVLGHIFPVFAGFKGGKGVACLFGIILAIVPIPTLIALGIFLVTLFTTRYVSLSSIISGVAFPFLIMFVFKTNIQSLIIFSLIVAVLLLLTHQKNIERLIRREESKASFLFKKKKGNSEEI